MIVIVIVVFVVVVVVDSGDFPLRGFHSRDWT